MTELLTVDQAQALAAVRTPGRTDSYEPVPYLKYVEKLGEYARDWGWTPKVESVSLVGRRDDNSPEGGKRLFGVMSLKETAEDTAVLRTDAGMTLDNDNAQYAQASLTVGNDPFGLATTIGFRASHDKSMACGVVAGARVFVCSNMAFSGEWVYHRKHTQNVWDDLETEVNRFLAGLRNKVHRLGQFQDALREKSVTHDEAKAMIVDSVLHGAMPGKHVEKVWAEVVAPSYPEVYALGPVAYRVYSAITHASYKGMREDKVMAMSANLTRVMLPRVPHWSERN